VRALRALSRGCDGYTAAVDEFGPDGLWFTNGMRVLGALHRRGWIDDNNEITEAGRAALARGAGKGET
jgi:hypothetical protein